MGQGALLSKASPAPPLLGCIWGGGPESSWQPGSRSFRGASWTISHLMPLCGRPSAHTSRDRELAASQPGGQQGNSAALMQGNFLALMQGNSFPLGADNPLPMMPPPHTHTHKHTLGGPALLSGRPAHLLPCPGRAYSDQNSLRLRTGSFIPSPFPFPLWTGSGAEYEMGWALVGTERPPLLRGHCPKHAHILWAAALPFHTWDLLPQPCRPAFLCLSSLFLVPLPMLLYCPSPPPIQSLCGDWSWHSAWCSVSSLTSSPLMSTL